MAATSAQSRDAPATGLLAVTVTGASLLWADVAATAAFARSEGAAGWLAGLAGYSGLVVDAAGTVTRIRWVRSVLPANSQPRPG